MKKIKKCPDLGDDQGLNFQGGLNYASEIITFF